MKIIVIVYWLMIMAMTYDEFKGDIEATKDRKRKVAVWFTWFIWPILVPFSILLYVFICLKDSIKDISSHRSSGKVFLDKRRYRNGSREYNRRGR